MARGVKVRVSKEAFWWEKIGEQAASGLSVSAYSRGEGLSPQSFYFWGSSHFCVDGLHECTPDFPEEVFEVAEAK
jgi:hypothetical protein